MWSSIGGGKKMTGAGSKVVSCRSLMNGLHAPSITAVRTLQLGSKSLQQRRRDIKPTISCAQERDVDPAKKVWVVSETDRKDGAARFVVQESAAAATAAAAATDQAAATAATAAPDQAAASSGAQQDVVPASDASAEDAVDAASQRHAASAAIMAALYVCSGICALYTTRSIQWPMVLQLLGDAATHVAHSGWGFAYGVFTGGMLLFLAMRKHAASNRADSTQRAASAAAAAEGQDVCGGDDGPPSKAAADSSQLTWREAAAYLAGALGFVLLLLVGIMASDRIWRQAFWLLVKDAAAQVARHGAPFFYGAMCGGWLLHWRHMVLR